MTDERNRPPSDIPDNDVPNGNTPPNDGTPTNTSPPAGDAPIPPDDLQDRLERLGGEPAPVITPEEFARLQKAGQVHIDQMGRVRTARREDTDGGVSLKKRRAWYA
ncbi:MAG: hypothetical protein SF162_12400 [bacterium]|nr:hypothetical protein [bacterium]